MVDDNESKGPVKLISFHEKFSSFVLKSQFCFQADSKCIFKNPGHLETCTVWTSVLEARVPGWWLRLSASHQDVCSYYPAVVTNSDAC